MVHLLLERVREEHIARVQKVHTLGADLGSCIGHFADTGDLFGCAQVKRPQHAGRAEKSRGEHIRLALNLRANGKGLGACDLSLDKLVSEKDVAELVRDGEARSLNACGIVVYDIPLIVAKERKTAFVRCELVGVAVLDHADPGILGNLQDVHRETVDLIVNQTLPRGAADVFVFSVVQNYHLGDSVCIPGGNIGEQMFILLL